MTSQVNTLQVTVNCCIASYMVLEVILTDKYARTAGTQEAATLYIGTLYHPLLRKILND
jgi:hypothetical protein